MSPDETPAWVSPEDPGDPTLIAAAVRAGIDALLTERAPTERDAFWRAVALYYAPPKRQEPKKPQNSAEPAGGLSVISGSEKTL
jgi:hypothetical protein